MTLLKKGAALMFALLFVLSLASCGGKADQDALHARYAVLYRADFLQEYLSDPEAHKAEIAAFGVEDFATVFADADAFHCYNAELSVGNTNDFAVSLLELHVDEKNIGKNGVYLGTLGDGVTVGLPAHFSGDNAMFYQVIAPASLSDEEVLEALAAQKAAIRYVDAIEDVDSVEEAQQNGVQISESIVSYDK